MRVRYLHFRALNRLVMLEEVKSRIDSHLHSAPLNVLRKK
jgi:hypothetical protein